MQLYWQPQVDLETNRIIGAETLLRWNSMDSGLLIPAQFISLAEETGLIVSIGEWVLRSACEQNKAWQDSGLPSLKVAVNLSARQLRQLNFVQTLGHILSETGMDPRYLDVEITEGQLMENIQVYSAILSELKLLGISISISINDFGTGYSSLSCLKHFPLDTLELDQSFIRNISYYAHDAAIVTTIITLAHSLQFKMMAEGVETQEQLEFLRSHGCDGMQGFFFRPPLPAEEFKQLLAQKGQVDLNQKIVRNNIATATQKSIKPKPGGVNSTSSGRCFAIPTTATANAQSLTV